MEELLKGLSQPEFHKQTRLIDIDGCIISHEKAPDDYYRAKALPGAVKTVNKWYDQGDYIVFFTGREEIYRTFTERYLKKLGFKFHRIIFDKPYSGRIDIYDDRVIISHKVERDIGIAAVD